MELTYDLSHGPADNPTNDTAIPYLSNAIYTKLANYHDQISKIDLSLEKNGNLTVLKAKIYDRGNNMMVLIERDVGLKNCIDRFITKAKGLLEDSQALQFDSNYTGSKQENILAYLVAKSSLFLAGHSAH